MNSNKRNWSLYCLLCPIDNEIRYVGKKGHQLARKLQANNMKPIKIWNEEQEYVFDSVNEGARQLNLDLGALWRVLNKKQKTHKGYKAKYI